MEKAFESGTGTGAGARMVSAAEAFELMRQGWAAADLHVHTLHSYDVMPTQKVHPLTLYHKARRLGMAYVAFTDPDSMAAYDEIGWTREGLIPAVEIKILDPVSVGHTVHTNIYGLDRRQFREISEIAHRARDIERLAAYLTGQSLPFTFNHPFWHEPGEKPSLRAIFDIAGLFPVLEYNMGRIARLNGEAVRLARAKGKGIIASTDTHVGRIGQAFTLARGATFREFFDHIREGQAFLRPGDLTVSALKEEAAFRMRQLFDKSEWLYPKDSLTIDTGSAFLDAIVRRQAKALAGERRLSSKILRAVLETVCRSGIPAALYVRDQHGLAERIGLFLDASGKPPEGPLSPCKALRELEESLIRP